MVRQDEVGLSELGLIDPSLGDWRGIFFLAKVEMWNNDILW